MTDQLAQLDPTELSKMPSTPPPPGATVDFDVPNPLKTMTITVTSVFMALAFLFIGIRAYTKMKIYRKGSWDDLTCTLGLMVTLCYWIILLLQVVNEGFGHHFWNVPLIITLSNAFLKLAYLSDWLCNFAYIFVKLTFLILYWNIFKPFRWLKFGIVGGAVVIVGVYTAFILASAIGATPRAGQTWLESSQTSRNGTGKRLSIPLAAWAMVSDVFILLLPISGVLRLQLSPKKKLALSMVFMTGIGACVCSSLSLYYRTLLKDEDVTYTVVRIQILVVVELCVGICITCMPTASKFLRHTLPPAGALRSTLISYTSKFRSSLHLRQKRSSHENSSYQDRTDDIVGPYRNLRDREQAVGDNEVCEFELYSAQAVKTSITAAPFQSLSDGIHMRVDLEQV